MTHSCHCELPKPSDIIAESGTVLGRMCNFCHRAMAVKCRVCMEEFRSLAHHYRRNRQCARFDREGMWWSRERPPTARYRETS